MDQVVHDAKILTAVPAGGDRSSRSRDVELAEQWIPDGVPPE